VDFVVPAGQTPTARQELRNAGVFTIEPGTLHTYYQGVEIEILAPPALFKEPYNAETPTIEVQQVRILKPALILNAKCRSILGRANEEKKTYRRPGYHISAALVREQSTASKTDRRRSAERYQTILRLVHCGT
jgi:hypothetical protein